MVDSHQNIYDLIIQSGHLRGDAVYVFEKAGGEKTICHAKDLFKNITAFEKDAFKNIKKSDRILDIGAGGGRISFYLQEKGYDITALEKSKLICRVLRKRELKKIVNKDLFSYHPSRRYDIVLLIKVYSAFGQSKKGTVKLTKFLANNLIKKNGRLIIVLADLGKGVEKIKRRFVFQNKIGPWFESFCPPFPILVQLAKKNGFTLEKSKWSSNRKEYFLILRRDEVGPFSKVLGLTS